MVCREIKGQSGANGYAKHTSAAHGEVITDPESQSATHQFLHDLEGVENEPVTYAEAEPAIRAIIEKMAKDPTLSHEAKYRKSHKRPGTITRLEQELERIRTGKHENGKPLTSAQTMTRRNFLAMVHAHEVTAHAVEGRRAFLENYARQTGGTYQDAQGRWKELMTRKGDHVYLNQIGDDERKNLQLAGINNETLHQMGVSGKAMDAVRIMYGEMSSNLDNLDQRNAIDVSNLAAVYRRTDDPRRKLQCKGRGGCGQFGHERAECPNQDVQQQKKEAETRERQFAATLEAEKRGNWAKKASDAEIRAEFDLDDTDNVARWRKEALEEYARLDKDGSGRNFRNAAVGYRRALGDKNAAIRELDERRVLFHDEAAQVFYNPDAGTLIVARHDNADGEDQPSIIRRCNQMEANAFMERLRNNETLASALDSELNQDHNRFANAADAAAATQHYRCPNCQRFASMNTSHQCPVKGSRQHRDEQELLRDRMEARQKQREALRSRGERVASLKVNEDFMARKHVRSRTPMKVRDDYGRQVLLRNESGDPLIGIERAFPERDDVFDTLRKGQVAVVPLDYRYSDGAQVSGRATLWPSTVTELDGTRKMATVASVHATGIAQSGLKCSCATYRKNGKCSHIDAVSRSILTNGYGAERLADPDIVPGDSFNETGGQRVTVNQRVAPDMMVMDAKFNDVDRVLAVKQARRAKFIEEVQSHRAEGMTQQGSTLAAEVFMSDTVDRAGNAVNPTAWTPQEENDKGRRPNKQLIGKELDSTDLTDMPAVAQRLRQALSNIEVTYDDGTTERIKYRVNTRNYDPNSKGTISGLRIELPTKFDKAPASQRDAALRTLAKRMGYSSEVIKRGNIMIPNHPGMFAETLDRAWGNVHTRRWDGPRVIRGVAGTRRPTDAPAPGQPNV